MHQVTQAYDPKALPLSLTRSLCVFDCEATGLHCVDDRIVSLSILKLTPGDMLRVPAEEWYDQMFNPGFPMSADVIAVHGITDEMVKDKPRFDEEAQKVHAFMDGCDLCGFNCTGFDVPILWESFHRAGIEWNLEGVKIVDTSGIFRKKEPRDLSAAVKKYCGREHVDAHSAHADVEATRDVLVGQLWHYDDLFEMSLDQLAEFSQQDRRLDLAGIVVLNDKNEPVYTHKKVRGVRVQDDPGYAAWILRTPGFSENTRSVLRKLLTPIHVAI